MSSSPFHKRMLLGRILCRSGYHGCCVFNDHSHVILGSQRPTSLPSISSTLIFFPPLLLGSSLSPGGVIELSQYAWVFII